MPAPTLTTARLTLRHHAQADFVPLYALFASDRARFMGGAIDRSKTWYWVAAEVGSWDILGHGSWGVETRDGQFVGQVGINQPPHFPEPEIGWLVLAEAEGKGYAHEAASAALGWGWQHGFDTLVSYIDPKNHRSIRLAERLGAVADPSAPLPSRETRDETTVYRHRRPQ